jgi:hypothetical protein
MLELLLLKNISQNLIDHYNFHKYEEYTLEDLSRTEI